MAVAELPGGKCWLLPIFLKERRVPLPGSGSSAGCCCIAHRYQYLRRLANRMLGAAIDPVFGRRQPRCGATFLRKTMPVTPSASSNPGKVVLGLLLQRHALASAAAASREAGWADFELSAPLTQQRSAGSAPLAAPALHPDTLDDPPLRSMRLACHDARSH